MASSEQIDHWKQDIEAIISRGTRLINGLDSRSFNFKLSPDRWSVAQCISHLNKVNLLLAPAFREGLEKAPKNETKRLWKPGKFESIFLKVVSPNPPFPVPVPPPYIPELTAEPEESLEIFIQTHKDLLACLETARNIDVSKYKITSPAAKFIKLTVGGWYEGNCIHDNYHLGQAEKVLEEVRASQ